MKQAISSSRVVSQLSSIPPPLPPLPPPQPRSRLLLASLAAAVPLLLLPISADAKLPPVKDPASNIGYLTNKEVDKKRNRSVSFVPKQLVRPARCCCCSHSHEHPSRANFVRAYDGHVSLQNRFTKAWTDVKCDLQVPGLLLLRDAGGEVSVLEGL
jgi:hypothetical protein